MLLQHNTAVALNIIINVYIPFLLYSRQFAGIITLFLAHNYDSSSSCSLSLIVTNRSDLNIGEIPLVI